MIAWIVAIVVGLVTFAILQFAVGPERRRGFLRPINGPWQIALAACSIVLLVVGGITEIPEVLILGSMGIAISVSRALTPGPAQ